jgi:hypothetical protein
MGGELVPNLTADGNEFARTRPVFTGFGNPVGAIQDKVLVFDGLDMTIQTERLNDGLDVIIQAEQ